MAADIEHVHILVLIVEADTSLGKDPGVTVNEVMSKSIFFTLYFNICGLSAESF